MSDETVTLESFAGFPATARALGIQPSAVAEHAIRVEACRPDASLIADSFDDERDADEVMTIRLVGAIREAIIRHGADAMADALEPYDLNCVRFGRDLLIAEDIETLQQRIDNLREVDRESPASNHAPATRIVIDSGDEIEDGQ